MNVNSPGKYSGHIAKIVTSGNLSLPINPQLKTGNLAVVVKHVIFYQTLSIVFTEGTMYCKVKNVDKV